MATNGASARQWLADKGQQASPQELMRIRDAIASKLDNLGEDHPDEPGLLEALDVMDAFIEGDKSPEPEAANLSHDSSSVALDTGPLVADLPPAEALSEEEKRQRFQTILKSGQSFSDNK